MDSRPRIDPRAAPVSSTASVWSVNGTGVIDEMVRDTCAARPVSPAPAATRTTSRTSEPGIRSARTRRGRATATADTGTPSIRWAAEGYRAGMRSAVRRVTSGRIVHAEPVTTLHDGLDDRRIAERGAQAGHYDFYRVR